MVLFSLLTTSVAVLEEDVHERMISGNFAPDEEKALSELGFLVDDFEHEKLETASLLERINQNSNALNVIVVLNMMCNLNCVYCYQGRMKDSSVMSAETAERLVGFVTNRMGGDIKSVNVDFYGGEPLLSIDLIKDIATRLKIASESRGMEFGFTLVTNGALLTRKVANELTPLGLKSAKVTLDGPPRVHDALRPFKGGKGSFSTILDNVKEVCDLLRISVGGNFREDNYREFPELLDMLISEGLTPEKIANVKFDPVVSDRTNTAPGDFTDGLMSPDEPWLNDASLYLRGEILKRGFETAEIAPSPCMVHIKDELVVNHDGYLYKCPGLIGKEDFRVGDIGGGDIDDSKAYGADSWKNDECKECRYLPICFGGCAYVKFISGGDMEKPDCRRKHLDATLEAFLRQDVRYRYSG